MKKLHLRTSFDKNGHFQFLKYKIYTYLFKQKLLK